MSPIRTITAAVALAPLAFFVAAPSQAASTGSTASAAPAATASPTAKAAATSKVNINTATSKQLQAVKGVGPKMAKEIMEYRPYKDFAKLEQKLTKYFPLSAVKAVEPSLTV